jgi:hypothetical protein
MVYYSLQKNQEIDQKESSKRVSFAKTLVQKPLKQVAQPPGLIRFGSFLVPLPSISSDSGVVSLAYIGDKFEFHLDRGRVLRDSPQPLLPSSDAKCVADSMEAYGLDSNSNLSLGLVGCSHCLGVGHDHSSCVSKIRCRACYNYGHVQRKCLIRARSNQIWIRKATSPNRFDSHDSLDSHADNAEKLDSLCSQTEQQLHPQIEALKFMAANKLCADQLFYSRNGLSDGFTMRGINPLILNSPSAISAQSFTVGSIIIDKGTLGIQEVEDEVFVPNGLDLVPYRPVIHAVMLKVLAENLQRREEVNVSAVVQSAPQAQSGSLHTLMGPSPLFEFGATQGQPTTFQPSTESASSM